MRFYDLCGIMPGRPAKLIVNLCEQPGCSLPSPLHLTHCLAEEEKEASRGIERVQRLRFRSQQLSLSSLNFNGKAKFFQLSFHTLPLSLLLCVCLSPSASGQGGRTSWQPSFWRLETAVAAPAPAAATVALAYPQYVFCW